MESNPDQSKEKLSSKDSANGTFVSTPEGEKRIQDFNVGDSVLAFSAKQESGKIKLESFTAKVNFIAGTGDFGHQSMMVYILIKAVDFDRDIICTMDQVYLLSNGKYTTANKLRPGLQLVNKDGNPLEIKNVSFGAFHGGVHNIATNTPNDSPDGHLILTNGVIAGDFTLQLNYHRIADDLKYEDDYYE